jgi:hypothetical protein
VISPPVSLLVVAGLAVLSLELRQSWLDWSVVRRLEGEPEANRLGLGKESNSAPIGASYQAGTLRLMAIEVLQGREHLSARPCITFLCFHIDMHSIQTSHWAFRVYPEGVPGGYPEIKIELGGFRKGAQTYFVCKTQKYPKTHPYPALFHRPAGYPGGYFSGLPEITLPGGEV